MSTKTTTKKPELIISNKKIIDFYSKNPQLDFEIMNLIFVDFLEKIMTDINGTINNVITNDILANVKDMSKEIASLKSIQITSISQFQNELLTNVKDMSKEITFLRSIQTNSTSQFQNELFNVKDSVNKLNSEISNNILSKINEIKKDYIEDLKSIINSNEKTNVLKIIEIMDKQNDILLTKTINFINDVLPKSQIQYYNQLETIIKTFREETNKNILDLKNNKSDINIEKIAEIFEQKQNNFITSVQQPLLNYISLSEERVNNEKSNVLKIIDVMEKQNDILLAKTINFINDILPKSQIQYYNQLEAIIKNFREETNKNIVDLKNNKGDLNMDKIGEVFEQKQNQFINSVQQPLLNYITSSEERVTNNIRTLSDNSKTNNDLQNKVNDELLDFLKKNNSVVSVTIGENGEKRLYNLLTKLYPNGEIINCSNLAKHGDIIMKRNLKKSILFENKHHSSNVPKDEVLKFIRDCDEQNVSGLLLSHNTGISNKNNFQIDIQNNNVLVYIHNCNYDEYKIQTCVSLIDHLTDILCQIKNETNNNILSDELLIEINQEFQTFLNQKETLINFIKESNKKIINQITDIELPSLHKLLASKFASTKTLNLKCDICNKFTGTNSKSLASHKNKCLRNKKNEEITNIDENNINENIPPIEDNNISPIEDNNITPIEDNNTETKNKKKKNKKEKNITL